MLSLQAAATAAASARAGVCTSWDATPSSTAVLADVVAVKTHGGCFFQKEVMRSQTESQIQEIAGEFTNYLIRGCVRLARVALEREAFSTASLMQMCGGDLVRLDFVMRWLVPLAFLVGLVITEGMSHFNLAECVATYSGNQ